ncbi:MAG: CoA transferase, partial [Thermoanaerobaculia bacterium]|nr:CoA transferase [Thermoanaerobaculia bacterium]
MSDRRPDPLFAGLRVIDAASFIAAPTAAMILGDLGADVIKIEPPGEGDPYRAIIESPGLPQSGIDDMWIMDSRCKRSLSLNLKAEAGREILLRLVADCDVYITNQPFPVRRRLALEYEDLAPLNPRLIYASLTAFGEKGPERDTGGFDGVAYWGRSGLEDLVRARDARPAPSLPGQGDHPTGISLYAAILTALYRRERTGEGGHVHTSLLANGFWSNGCLGSSALAGADFEEWRSRPPDHPGSFTRALYETSDGRFLQLIMARSEEEHAAAFRVAGLGDMLEEPRFATQESQFENVGPIIEAMTRAIASRPAAEWLAAFREAGVPCDVVRRTEEMAEDEQAKVNEVLMPADVEALGTPWVINHPVRVDGAPERGPVPPPRVGEHTDEILAELGFEPEAIA